MTGRAILRQHRFAPEQRIVDTIWYCLAVAAQKYQVQLHGFVWMSNHYHLVLTDIDAELPDFMRDLNSLISKALNAVRKIQGQNFARGGYNAVAVADGAKILEHCAYSEANPCRAGLVATARGWGSVTSANMEFGQRKSVRRPKYGLWSQAKSGDCGNMDPRRELYCGRIRCPEIASFELVRPPCLNGESAAATRAQVREQVREREEEARQWRDVNGRTVMGMEKARAVAFTDAPSSQEAFFGTEPTVSGKDAEGRSWVQREYEEFVARYRSALEKFREKGNASFPEGTWWMRRCLNLDCYAYTPSG